MYTVKSSNRFFFWTIVFQPIISFIILSMLDYIITPSYFSEAYVIVLPDLIATLFIMFGPVLFYISIKKGFLKNSILIKNPGVINLIAAFFLTLTLFPLIALITTISNLWVKDHIGEFIETYNNVPFLLSLISIAVFPAIFEEIFTRFVILNNYRHKPYYVACIISGLFFGIMHMNFDQFIYAFVLGVILAFVVLITGSIYTSIFIHFLFNGLPDILNAIFPNNAIEAAENMTTAIEPSLWEDILSLLITNAFTIPIMILILWFLIRYNRKSQILKAKPTTMELALGQKLPEITNPDMIAFRFNKNDKIVEVIPNFEYFQQHPTEEIPDRTILERYLAKFQSPFNFAFWASIIFFILVSISLELG